MKYTVKVYDIPGDNTFNGCDELHYVNGVLDFIDNSGLEVIIRTDSWIAREETNK